MPEIRPRGIHGIGGGFGMSLGGRMLPDLPFHNQPCYRMAKKATSML
jgi:hypothetical protein